MLFAFQNVSRSRILDVILGLAQTQLRRGSLQILFTTVLGEDAGLGLGL
jgi:hypothetical protein